MQTARLNTFKSVSQKTMVFLVGILFCFTFSSSAQTLVPADNATNVSKDMVFKLSFATAPTLQSAGKINLYTSGGTLVETIDLSKMPTGTPLSASWPWIVSLNGNDIRVIPVTVDGKSVYIRFSNSAMSYSTGYYVTVDQNIFSNASAIGFSGISANNWSITTRAQPAADLNYTVAADGTGDFATLQGVLDFLPTGKTNAKILVKNGTYVGLAFCKGKSNFTIEGESKTGVIIKGFNNSNLNASTHWRSVVNLQGDDINLISLTFINSTPNGGTQAEALKLNGLRCVIVNCEFYSYQDTVLIEGKVYFKDCMLEGDVDFVWGVGTVFFQSCEIRANDNGGYNVMARNDNTKHGYAFADCKITRKTTTTATQYLGRDAGASYPYAEIVYLNCTLGAHIPATGWSINSAIDASNIIFAEYRSVNESGALINTSGRNSKSKQLTESQNTQYRDLNWFFNGWTPVVPTYGIKDCAGILNGTAYKDDCDVCVGGTTGKTACIKDCNGVLNGTASLDNCSRCIGGTTGKTACALSGEAENDACTYDGTEDSDNTGFKGTGFINVTNAIGSKITFDIYTSTAGTKTISFRYANGGTTNRSGDVYVNSIKTSSVAFAPTGAFTTYAALDLNLTLNAGNNAIQLISATAAGLANIDQIGYVSAGLSKGSCVVTGLQDLSEAVAVHGYPNPFVDKMLLSVSGTFDYEIRNQDGQLLEKGTGHEKIEVGVKAPRGFYLIKIMSQGQIQWIKALKE